MEIIRPILIIVASGVVLWRIAVKLGYPGKMALLGFVPIVDVMLLVYIAFAEWPIERELKRAGIPLPRWKPSFHPVTVLFTCPNCTHAGSVKWSYRGTVIRCPECKERVMVPDPEEG